MPHSKYLPEKMGSATVEPSGSFEAGSYQSFKLTYTAGYFGIDDTGSIKIVHRFASDMGKPQFDDPSAANYVSVVASNGAVLHVEYDMKRNIRPWDKTLYIKVVRGFLREGDQIIVHFGDRSGGSPGIRIQTFCEHSFEFRVLVDAIATYNYVELPQQPKIAIVPGKPYLWKAIVPTIGRTGETFRLSIKAEDRWGNPSDQCDQTILLLGSAAITGLPETITIEPGQRATVIENLTVNSLEEYLTIDLLDEESKLLARSNPLRILADAELLPFWGDLHGQSEETIGTNSARDFHQFARDLAFLDATAHQGNDFQITSEFWHHLNDLTREFNQDHRFIAFPGYEWSGNTGLGGDRNVLYLQEGQPIHRSSHALVDDLSDIDSDANSARDLFTRLQDRDCVVFAHIGGRYADVKMAHDERLETSVEVHSAWGSFEWLVEDALEKGYRVGIVSNSDGHKGRPGASHPGATKFGSYGGLTCMLATELTREALADCIRRRHHYGTTGCRMILDLSAKFGSDAELFDSDPKLGDTDSHNTRSAMMGDILRCKDEAISLQINAVGSAPIERIEIRNGLQTLVRIPPGRWDTAARVMDFGALGVIAPMINSAADAVAFAMAIRCPPTGERSFGPRFAASLYNLSVNEYLESIDACSVALAMIETRQAYSNLDEILEVDGIDGILIGPSDLSISLRQNRIPDPYGVDSMHVITDSLLRCANLGKKTAAYSDNPQTANMLNELGVDVISVGNDQTYITNGVASHISGLNFR